MDLGACERLNSYWSVKAGLELSDFANLRGEDDTSVSSWKADWLREETLESFMSRSSTTITESKRECGGGWES